MQGHEAAKPALTSPGNGTPPPGHRQATIQYKITLHICANTDTSKKKKFPKVLRFSSFHLGPTGFFREAKEYSQNTHSSPAHLLKPMLTQMLSQSLEGIKNLSKFLTWSTELNKHKEVCLHGHIGLSLFAFILFAQSTMATQKYHQFHSTLFPPHFTSHGTRV